MALNYYKRESRYLLHWNRDGVLRLSGRPRDLLTGKHDIMDRLHLCWAERIITCINKRC